jgi:hypothetical protein
MLAAASTGGAASTASAASACGVARSSPQAPRINDSETSARRDIAVSVPRAARRQPPLAPPTPRPKSSATPLCVESTSGGQRTVVEA